MKKQNLARQGVYFCNLSTQKTEAGRLGAQDQPWPGQLGLQSETLSQESKHINKKQPPP
jgi:hypothetical protein